MAWYGKRLCVTARGPMMFKSTTCATRQRWITLRFSDLSKVCQHLFLSLNNAPSLNRELSTIRRKHNHWGTSARWHQPRSILDLTILCQCHAIINATSIAVQIQRPRHLSWIMTSKGVVGGWIWSRSEETTSAINSLGPEIRPNILASWRDNCAKAEKPAEQLCKRLFRSIE